MFPQTTCHGILHKKQERGEDGRKSNDRSWKTYFAVLRGNQIVFYKDRKDAEMVRDLWCVRVVSL